MELSIIRDGHRFPYSETELRRDNPTVLFPKGLVGVDFDQYGVIAENIVSDLPQKAVLKVEHAKVGMHRWLWALRDIGMHVHFERYRLECQGYTRDYWNAAPEVTKSSSQVAHFREYFGMSDSDFNVLWDTTGSYEE